MFKVFTNLFHRDRNMVSYLSRMKSPEQMVRNLHAQGVDLCFDQAEKIMQGIHEDGMEEDDIQSICGLDA